MRLAELLCPLAAAADAGAALPPETAQRTALIALGLGEAMGLSAESRSDLLYAGLLRHLGCSATAHEETRLMGDEQELRAALTPVDAASPVQMLQGAGRGFAKGRSRLQRVRVVAGFLAQAPKAVPRIFAARCEVSAMLGRRLGLSEGALRALDETYERFDGKGLPKQRKSAELSSLTSVLAVAEYMAMLMPLPGGEALAFETLKQRSGGQFDPLVVSALCGAQEAVLSPARRDAPLAALLDLEPRPHKLAPEIRVVAQVLADFVDLKSTFTLGHSRNVARLACNAAQAIGLGKEEVEAVELAGLLHDLGRVSVSNAIWDKPGALDAGEWEKVHAHPQFTERVLRTAGPFAELARLAASDHERMDSKGYPRGVAPSGAARILAAADLVQSLSEPRPYRAAFSAEKAAAIAVEAVEEGRLERAAVNAVLEALGQKSVRAAAPRGLTERELEVLKLLARGQVDKEIAAALGISHRTVHHHNQSIFSKLAVTTRGAAALFATEQGLL
ncbi:MAG TPA: HD domain-containing phosphohydrolase [Polyangiaceae bacterium]|nr:HD domain-containing phosphohydrolase [Polyangiaceae bacterium]